MNKQKPSSTSSTLLASGKSSRLQEMRNKSLKPDQIKAAKESIAFQTKPKDAELLIAQQIIDQRLADILAGLPVGKQCSLFRIRYGIELEQIKQQPIKHIIRLLKINHPQLTRPQGDMKRILDLTYNGQQSQ